MGWLLRVGGTWDQGDRWFYSELGEQALSDQTSKVRGQANALIIHRRADPLTIEVLGRSVRSHWQNTIQIEANEPVR